jgi:phosphohistidine phosphatase
LPHAKSDWSDSQVSDFDRPLNARGRAAAAAVGCELGRRQVQFDSVLASPAVRVRQTLEQLATRFGPLPATQFVDAVYDASAADLLALVRSLPATHASVLLSGHNPGLQQLVLALTAPESRLRSRVEHKFPTAAVALIELPVGSWAQASGGEIAGLIVARELESQEG